MVEFLAEDGEGIAPGEFQEFSLSGGPFPEAESLTFNTVHVYSDGTEAAWIEPTGPGQPELERPAPVLPLTGESGTATDAHGGTSTDAGTETGSGTTTDTTTTGGTMAAAADGGGNGTAVAALVVAVLGLLAGLAGLGLGLSARRRTVSG